MEHELYCNLRRINKINIATPLLIPSFSSAVDRRISEVHSNLREYIPNASLVSAYDLKYDYIDEKQVWASDVVYVDSGNYEHDKSGSLEKKEWSAHVYSTLLDRIKPLTKVVIVNFDEKKKLEMQIDDANELFAKYPEYASCFLCRPQTKRAFHVDVSKLSKNISFVKNFNILGLSEKELGSSLFERCKNLIEIRKALMFEGLEIPIHIFGCLDPLGVIVFFLCGADIFDGTNWLKYSFHNNLALYINNYVILSGAWSESDVRVHESTYVFNLSKLGRLLRDMKRYIHERNLGVFNLNDEILKQVNGIISKVKENYG